MLYVSQKKWLIQVEVGTLASNARAFSSTSPSSATNTSALASRSKDNTKALLTVRKSVHSLCGAWIGMPGIFAHPVLNPFSPRAGTRKYLRRPCTGDGTKATLAIVCCFLAARPG